MLSSSVCFHFLQKNYQTVGGVTAYYVVALKYQVKKCIFIVHDTDISNA